MAIRCPSPRCSRSCPASPTRRAARSSIRLAIGKTKAYLRRACDVQLEGTGFAIVEVISNCPVGWGMTPRQSMDWLRDHVAAVYPPGVLIDRGRSAPPAGEG